MRYKSNALLKAPDCELLREQDGKGVATFEEEYVKKLTVSVIGIPSGNLYLKYAAGSFSATFPLTRLKNAEFVLPDEASSGGGVLIYDDTEGVKTSLLYGAFSQFAPSAENMLTESESFGKYDDEVVATENYYEYDKQKHGFNELIGEDSENDEIPFGNGNEMLREKNNGKEQENEGKFDAFKDAANFGDSIGEEVEKNYYERVKDELDKIFKGSEEEKALSGIVKDSKWVKINYGEGKHYVVGIIFDDNVPLYICYGVPGKYGERPSEIKDYCSFIPSSPFNLKSFGYWVMYQDAASGKIIR